MDLRRHQDWSTPTFDRRPVAPAVGPFARREFLRAVTDGFTGGEVAILDSGEGVVVVSESEDRVTLAGDPELTDYHCPVGDGVDRLLATYLDGLEPGVEIDFDSLPVEAVDPLVAGLESAGIDPKVEQHEVSAVLTLPDTFDGYLDAIGKKQRHELRRKRRRYTDVVGELLHETHGGDGWAFAEFVRLHRLAPGEKGRFMTPGREAFFRHLAGSGGWRIDLLRVPGTDRASACLFSFTDEEGLYLYNASYDAGLAEASPGVAIVGSMIERAIAESIPRFDFLKGGETYKFRLGGERRPLHRVRGVT